MHITDITITLLKSPLGVNRYIVSHPWHVRGATLSKLKVALVLYVGSNEQGTTLMIYPWN